jgi:hypothetical protein
MPEIRPSRHRKLSTTEAATIASHARLKTSNWDDLTRAANASSMHVGSMTRWRVKALESNPALSGVQLDRLALIMKQDFYREIGRRSGLARRIRRELAAVEPAA